MSTEDSIPEWDELSPEEQLHTRQFLEELDKLFTKYIENEDKPCEDSI